MTDTDRVQVLYPLYRKVIREGIDYLGGKRAELELWVNFNAWPEYRKMFPNVKPTDTGGTIGLGPITRTERLLFNATDITIIQPDKSCVDVPYKAIYNVAIQGVHPDLGWATDHSDKRKDDITFWRFGDLAAA